MSLKEAFLKKYPKYNCILLDFEAANGCECSFENLTKLRLQTFADASSSACTVGFLLDAPPFRVLSFGTCTLRAMVCTECLPVPTCRFKVNTLL